MIKIRCTNCGAKNAESAQYCTACGHQLDRSSLPKRSVIGMIVGGVAFIICYMIGQYLFSPKTPSYAEIMKAMEDTVNNRCPLMVDEYSRLDSANSLPGNQFQYNYTLVNISKSEVNYDTVRKYIEPQLLNNVRTNPELQLHREHKLTFIYSYFDRNGIPVIKFTITPDKYQ